MVVVLQLILLDHDATRHRFRGGYDRCRSLHFLERMAHSADEGSLLQHFVLNSSQQRQASTGKQAEDYTAGTGFHSSKEWSYWRPGAPMEEWASKFTSGEASGEAEEIIETELGYGYKQKARRKRNNSVTLSRQLCRLSTQHQ